MSNTTDLQRIQFLEAKAKELFIENSEWSDVLSMLPPEELDEYNVLMDK
jgi:hypothetical protein